MAAATLAEATAVAVAASAVGVLAGIGIAGGLQALFPAIGFPFPDGDLVISGLFVALPIAVGVLVCLGSALLPALRAGRTAPLAALRETAVDHAVRFLGSPLDTVRGITGSLARRNALRSPKRTAATATALMIGVAVVSLFTVFGASLKTTMDQAVSKSFAGDVLALAVVIALLGIANTLTLAVHERTRELGLLRAVGQTRGRLRAMVRWESVLVAAFGTAGGLGLGAFLGWVLVKASDSAGTSAFALPLLQLTVVALVGLLAGAVAGLRPARRAARLDVLRAIATE